MIHQTPLLIFVCVLLMALAYGVCGTARDIVEEHRRQTYRKGKKR